MSIFIMKDIIENYPSPKMKPSTMFWCLTILDLLQMGIFHSQNELKDHLFHPFQHPYGNPATSVVGSLLILIILIKYLLNTYYVLGDIQNSLYALSHSILTKSHKTVTISNSLSQMIRLWLPINECSIDSFYRYEYKNNK